MSGIFSSKEIKRCSSVLEGFLWLYYVIIECFPTVFAQFKRSVAAFGAHIEKCVQGRVEVIVNNTGCSVSVSPTVSLFRTQMTRGKQLLFSFFILALWCHCITLCRVLWSGWVLQLLLPDNELSLWRCRCFEYLYRHPDFLQQTVVIKVLLCLFDQDVCVTDWQTFSQPLWCSAWHTWRGSPSPVVVPSILKGG